MGPTIDIKIDGPTVPKVPQHPFVRMDDVDELRIAFVQPLIPRRILKGKTCRIKCRNPSQLLTTFPHGFLADEAGYLRAHRVPQDVHRIQRDRFLLAEYAEKIRYEIHDLRQIAERGRWAPPRQFVPVHDDHVRVVTLKIGVFQLGDAGRRRRGHPSVDYDYYFFVGIDFFRIDAVQDRCRFRALAGEEIERYVGLGEVVTARRRVERFSAEDLEELFRSSGRELADQRPIVT